MKNLIRGAICFLCIMTVIVFGSCSKGESTKYINLATYYEMNVICYDETNKSTNVDLAFFTGEKTPEPYRFSQIIFDGKSKWTNDLFIESIEFDVFSNDNAVFDFSLSISNIADTEGENVFYSEEYAYYYFRSSFSISMKKDSTLHKKITIGKTLNDREGGIGLVLDKDSTLALSSSLGYFVTNFKVVAYHK